MARYIDCEVCGDTKHDDHFGEFEVCSECAMGMGADGGRALKELDRLRHVFCELVKLDNGEIDARSSDDYSVEIQRIVELGR